MKRAAALALLAALAGPGCAAPRQPAAGPRPVEACPAGGEVEHAVFFVGAAGEVRIPEHPEAELPVDPVMRALHDDVVAQVGALGLDRVTVVYLGDNVYPRGLVPDPGRERRRGERVLLTQIRAAQPARVIFTAGSHDWAQRGVEGWSHVREQAAFLAAQGERVEMLPEGGCPGPVRVDFGKHLVLVFVDPLGFGHAAAAPAVHARSCPQPDAQTAFSELVRVFDGPQERSLVLALHHPIVTAGPEGGHFSLKQHLFPLTDFWPWAWVPLPVLGSLYPVARELGVTRTDVTRDAYRRWIHAIYRATRPGAPVLFAAGHEHSLQLHRDAFGTYHAVSGAASRGRVDRVERLDTALFARAEPGYMRLDAYRSGALGLTTLGITGGDQSRELLGHCLVSRPGEAALR